jgi:hypothetical protein
MALDVPTPWITAPNVVGALSAGASAGASAAHIAAQRESEGARLAQQAMLENQRNQMEAAQLSQAERLATMEMQARKEIAQQNQLRESQRLAIQDAYHTAQIGMAKSRLEEQQAVADAKARDAAMTIKREQDFGAAIAGGMPVIEAYKRFPVSASVVNAFTRAQIQGGEGGKGIVREGKYPLIRVDPKTGEAKEIWTPKVADLTTADKEDLRDLRHERDMLSKKLADTLTERISPTPPEQKALEQNRLKEINQQIEGIKRGSRLPKPPESVPTKFGHPKVGEVRSGYRFKGGDPSDQKNWELVNEGP